jgi:DNA-binding response OmpR family regulator
VAVLLLVEDGHHPPLAETCLEDWIRVPASEVDVRARIDALSVRSDLHGEHRQDDAPEPQLDEDGVLRAHGGWVAVPPVEARLLRAMLGRYGAVVSRENLSRAGWPDRAPERNVLDVHVLRLRRRLAPVGLVIRTVRSRGYLLESDRRQQAVRNA